MEHVSEGELRAMIRDAIAGRRRGDEDGGAAAPPAGGGASHQRLPMAGSGGDERGACLIEPEVPCTHCGYCQSYGH